MKYIFLLLLIPGWCQSQCRYYDRIFTDFSKTPDIVYGNSPAITSIYISESFTTAQDLKLDVFQPVGDVEPRRALILFAHSGGFINGSKEHEDMQALCDSFTHYGYVTASLEYRKNFNLLSSNSSERAVWRATQDASSAVRFFKQNAGIYQIDTNKIFVWGSSAGAFMALGLAYIDDSERPASTFTAPNLGCKDCTGNNFPFTSKVSGIISCWGATKDTSWIRNNNNIPVQLFHGTSDGTVPFAEGYPFGLPTIAYVRGSQQMNEQLNRTTIYHEFYPAVGEGHEYWGTSNGTFATTGPTAYWGDIINKAKNFMAVRIGALPVCAPLPLKLLNFSATVRNEKVTLYWHTSDEQNINKITVERSVDGTNFEHFTDIAPRGSQQTAASYSATDPYPFGGTSFYRLKIFNTNGSFVFSKIIAVQIPEKIIHITRMYPNPVNDILHIQIQSEKNITVQLTLSDILGKPLYKKNIQLQRGMNSSNLSLEKYGSGMYILTYQTAAGDHLGSFKIMNQ